MVIGLSGKSGSGKDTVFKIIKKLLENKKSVWQHTFAEAIKTILLHTSEIRTYTVLEQMKNSDEYIPNYSIDGEPVTVRQAMQIIGEHFKEKFGKNVWINALKPELENYKSYTNILRVITDVRFENEFDYVKNELEGILILITNPRSNNYNHISEEPIYREYDYVIENKGTLENLEEKVKKILIKEKLL